MKISDLLLIGGACLAGYLLWKQFSGDNDSFGGGIGGGDLFGIGDIAAPSAPITAPIYSPAGAPVGTSRSATAITAPTPSQSWSGVTYGQAGQPSVRFLAGTIQAASQPGASRATVQAAQAARAGAPPRMVAKIKAGQAILDGGKY